MIAAVQLQILRRETQDINVFRLRGKELQAGGEIVVVVEERASRVLGELFQDVHIGKSGLALILHFDVLGGHGEGIVEHSDPSSLPCRPESAHKARARRAN